MTQPKLDYAYSKRHSIHTIFKNLKDVFACQVFKDIIHRDRPLLPTHQQLLDFLNVILNSAIVTYYCILSFEFKIIARLCVILRNIKHF